MSSRFWASSEDVSGQSVDSSVGGAQDGARDLSSGADLQELSRDGAKENRSTAVVARSMATSSGLPDLQLHQHANLFYLSLIEGRCRKQATTAVNATRPTNDQLPEDHPDVLNLSRHMFDEVRRELVKAGMLPEFEGELPVNLDNYLRSFDNILDNIATQQTHNLTKPHTRAISNSTGLLLPGADTNIFNISNSLVPAGFFTTPNNLPVVLKKSYRTLLKQLFPNEDHSQDVSTVSNYSSDYKQISKLGAGGFGAVFKVRHKFDQAVYAVKKIVVKREKIQALYDQNNIGELGCLIREVQTLAKLNHHNIVRYHHCWIEPQPLNENYSDSSSEEDDSEEIFENTASVSLLADPGNALKHEMRVQPCGTASGCSVGVGADVGGFYFSDEELNEGKRFEDVDEDNVEDSDGDEEDDTEEIERTDEQIVRSSKRKLNFHLIFHIQMAIYPLSLQQYIGQNSEEWFKKNPDAPKIHHCYHVLPTVRLLLSILDGIEYIHRKKIIHRDVKPANILLEILDPFEPPTQGFVNVDNCLDCGNKSKSQPTFISPRIGDFGLVHDLSIAPPPPTPASAEDGDDDDDDDDEEKSRPVGTLTYLPIGLRKSSIICPKLDIYSLGIIAFEMSYKFGTSTERFMVLDQLKRFGKLPPIFQGHPLQEGILSMVKEDVGRRWDCPTVREYLERMLKEQSRVSTGTLAGAGGSLLFM